MITTNKSNLLRRCEERGYTLEEVMGCVVEQNGPLWTIDENHEAYPRENKPTLISTEYGVGTELKKMLSTIGIKSTPNCSCNAKAKHMNEKGIDWCKENKNLILDWLQEEANKRHLPFVRFAARKLLNFAIYRAEKKINA